jgi:hypothetical protein
MAQAFATNRYGTDEMRSNVPDDVTPATPDRSARHPKRIMMLSGVVALTVAAAGAGVLLRDTPRTEQGSPVPPATITSATPNPDESYLRQICGDDVNLTQKARLCIGHKSMSPSEIAEILDDLEQKASSDSR